MLRVALLGDSITHGIGSRALNYAPNLVKELQCEIANLAHIGSTIEYGLSRVSDVLALHPDIVIIMYGQVDAMPRIRSDAKINLYRLLPPRYKSVGGLDPRALYTSRRPKKYLQKADNEFRNFTRRLLMRVQGTMQYTPLDDFRRQYEELICQLKQTVDTIILVSTVTVDDKLFPGATNEFIRYNAVIRQLAEAHSLAYVDVYSELNQYRAESVYLADRYHPNSFGYQLISKEIARIVKQQIDFSM